MSEEFTAADLAAELSAASPARRTVRLCMRADLNERFAELEAELATAAMRDAVNQGLVTEAGAVAEQIEALRTEMEGHVREFTFEAVGPLAWNNLMRDHGPKPEHRRRGLDHDPETFPPAAVAASLVAPRMTVEQVTDTLFTNPRFTSGQWDQLWVACIELNKGGGAVPKSRLATGILQLNGQSSTSVANGASPEASS